MTCPCEKAPKMPEKKTCNRNTPAILQINSKECPVLFHTVNIPASRGDITSLPPTAGRYKNTRVYYEANRMSYLYDSDGIPQILSGTGLPEVTSVNGMAGDVTITLTDLGGATETALQEEATTRAEADDAFETAISSLDGRVTDNTAAIALKANSADVYTKAETTSEIAAQIAELGVPSMYWGQTPSGGVVSGSITLAPDDTVNWGQNNPEIIGNAMGSLMARSGVLNTDTTGQYTQLSVGRTGIVLDHYASGSFDGSAKISGVANGTAANDAVNLSQIQGAGWVTIGTASAYNKAGSVVSVTISETGTFTAGAYNTLFTLPEGFRPSRTITASATAFDNTNQTFVPAVVYINTDGTVQMTNINVNTDNVYGLVTFIV